jgi:hypothetical protein
MQHDITKLCADSLRSYLNDKHGIKLKSGHAHEIVAAFFGYKSKIALLADTQYPLSNLEKAEFVMPNPPTLFVDQRLKSLEGLPLDLPSSVGLIKGVYAPIVDDKKMLEKIWPTFHDLALHLAEERLQQHIGHWRINPAPQWITDVDMETTEAEILMTVTFDYPTDAGGLHRYSKMDIKLPRVAGNIGYGNTEVIPTFYSGQMRETARDRASNRSAQRQG